MLDQQQLENVKYFNNLWSQTTNDSRASTAMPKAAFNKKTLLINKFHWHKAETRTTNTFVAQLCMVLKLGQFWKYWGPDKSLTSPTSWCILFDGENILFDASLVIYIYKWYYYSSNYDYK